MASISTCPTLSTVNQIYLYDLLKREIGCGKQTFMPAVEQALESDRMTADDLSFPDTRTLLEALDPAVKLTVFKGGRVYATVIAQPEWDEALDAAAAGKTTGKANDKPWKRKKTNKALKAVRPKRVKRPAAIDEAAAQPPVQNDDIQEVAAVETADVVVTAEATAKASEPEPIAPEAVAPAIANDRVFDDPNATDAAGPQEAPVDEAKSLTLSNEKQLDEASVEQPALEPAITLTVTYDPYSGIDEETKLESNPHLAALKSAEPSSPVDPIEVPPAPIAKAAAKPQPASSENAPVRQAVASQAAKREPFADQAPAPHVEANHTATPPQAHPATPAATDDATLAQTQSATPETAPVCDNATLPSPACNAPRPEVLATYPNDFATEVYLDSKRIAELCELLPYGTDVFKLLAEDYARARELELISGTRARATFPLRIQHIDSIEPLTVTLKKRSGSGLKWELASVE